VPSQVSAWQVAHYLTISRGRVVAFSRPRWVPALDVRSEGSHFLQPLPLAPALFPATLDLVLGLRLVDRLPLHVGRIIRPAFRERHLVIHHVSGPAVRMAGLPHEEVKRVVRRREWLSRRRESSPPVPLFVRGLGPHPRRFANPTSRRSPDSSPSQERGSLLRIAPE